jgi:transposase
MLDGPPSQSDCDHWRAGCGESSHAPFGNRPTEKDPNQGHLAGGRVHSESGGGCDSRRRLTQALDRSAPVLPMMPGMPERRTHDYLRHGITTLFAALDVATGQVIGSIHRRHRAAEFRTFLAKLDKQVPAELDVHLICDNYSTHKAPTVRAWLDAHPRFHMHFTPTYSSWLNQVERWFGLLTDKQLRRGVHKNLQALERDIRAWIAQWNDNPQPFIWTKTADEILERLASYLDRIPGAGH